VGTEGCWYGARSVTTGYGSGDGKYTQIWEIAECRVGANNQDLMGMEQILL
jgi:hypothetical protein